ALDLPEVQRDERQNRELGGERLGRRDADLRPRVRQQRRVGLPGRLRALDVANGERLGATGRRFLHGRQGGGRPAAPGEGGGQRVRAHHRRAVAVLRGVVHVD